MELTLEQVLNYQRVFLEFTSRAENLVNQVINLGVQVNTTDSDVIAKLPHATEVFHVGHQLLSVACENFGRTLLLQLQNEILLVNLAVQYLSDNDYYGLGS